MIIIIYLWRRLLLVSVRVIIFPATPAQLMELVKGGLEGFIGLQLTTAWFRVNGCGFYILKEFPIRENA